MTPEDSWSALQFHSSKTPYYYVFLIFFLITFFLVWLLSRSKLGYRLRAVRDSHTYHYLAVKTKKLVIENQKLRLKKFNPAKQKHEWFVEAKLPPHSK